MQVAVNARLRASLHAKHHVPWETRNVREVSEREGETTSPANMVASATDSNA